MKIAMKYYAQYDKFSCGCICVKMLLERLWIKKKRAEIIESMWAVPLIWVESEDIIEYLHAQNLEILEKEETTLEELINYIKSGYPVIVNYINPLIKYWHYWIISGFCEKEEVFYFADPRTGQDYWMSFSDFEKNWTNRPENEKVVKRWALIAWRERIILN